MKHIIFKNLFDNFQFDNLWFLKLGRIDISIKIFLKIYAFTQKQVRS